MLHTLVEANLAAFQVIALRFNVRARNPLWNGQIVGYFMHHFGTYAICRSPGKNGRPQSQLFVLFASKIEQQITVRLRRCVCVRVLGVSTVVWVQLFGQMRKFSILAGVFEK